MQHKINYKRIFTLLGISAVIVAALLYVALNESKVEEYQFVGEWDCKQKEPPVSMPLKITETTVFENNKKLHDYYPKTNQVKENTYNLYNGNTKFARVKEINENKISYKKNIKDAKTYYCKRVVITKK